MYIVELLGGKGCFRTVETDGGGVGRFPGKEEGGYALLRDDFVDFDDFDVEAMEGCFGGLTVLTLLPSEVRDLEDDL